MEDTKGEIGSKKSKQVKQHNDKKKNNKRTIHKTYTFKTVHNLPTKGSS